jgi:uncharacterized protein (DUF849 family)
MKQDPDLAPFIMVAPNGGRKTKADHPCIPMTVPELLACADECRAAGADAMHAHVRDSEGNHVLDLGLYSELIAEAARTLPGLQIQITTESLGHYSAAEQRRLVRDLTPKHASVALREQDPDADKVATRRFYHWAEEAGVEIQHILYDPAERAWLEELQIRQIIPNTTQRVLFVLGRYSGGLASAPENLLPFLDVGSSPIRWMACAFGQAETDCLLEAFALGGDMRIGFENNVLNEDGSIAQDNAERVQKLLKRLNAHKANYVQTDRYR